MAQSASRVRPERLVKGTRTLVVIPALNEVKQIRNVIRTILTAPGLDLKVVVVDGGSTDGTTNEVRDMMQTHDNVYLLDNPQRVQAAGVNLAVRRFGQEADVLIRCDAHSHYPDRFCERIVESLYLNDADSVVVPLDTTGSQGIQRVISWVSNSFVGTGGSAHRGGRASGYVDHGHHAGFFLSSFSKTGGYNEIFTHNEDAELDCRQRALGARIYLDADIRVGYVPRDSLRKLWRQYFLYGAGRSRTVRVHPGSIRLRQLALPVHVLAFAASLLLATLWNPLAALWPVLYSAILATISVVFAVKHRSLWGLLAGPTAGIMHMAWGLGFLSGLLKYRDKPWTADNVSDSGIRLAPEPAQSAGSAAEPYRER